LNHQASTKLCRAKAGMSDQHRQAVADLVYLRRNTDHEIAITDVVHAHCRSTPADFCS
jgi:hypothetical protein